MTIKPPPGPLFNLLPGEARTLLFDPLLNKQKPMNNRISPTFNLTLDRARAIAQWCIDNAKVSGAILDSMLHLADGRRVDFHDPHIPLAVTLLQFDPECP